MPQVSWAIAGEMLPRKVRTLKSMVPGNTRGGEIYRIGPQKITAEVNENLLVKVKR